MSEQEKTKDTTVVIPRMNGKRIWMIAAAMRLAKEGKRVLIKDVGGQDAVLEPHNRRETNET